MDDSNDSSSTLESDSDSAVSPESTRKRKRSVKRSTYLAGKSRKVYKLNKELVKSLEDSPGINGVCSSCASNCRWF